MISDIETLFDLDRRALLEELASYERWQLADLCQRLQLARDGDRFTLTARLLTSRFPPAPAAHPQPEAVQESLF